MHAIPTSNEPQYRMFIHCWHSARSSRIDSIPAIPSQEKTLVRKCGQLAKIRQCDFKDI
jgi:hypothetical protein